MLTNNPFAIHQLVSLICTGTLMLDTEILIYMDFMIINDCYSVPSVPSLGSHWHS